MTELPDRDEDRLTFEQKLALVRKLVIDHPTRATDDKLQSLKNLNGLRNKLAHRLEDPNLVSQHLMSFVSEHWSLARTGRKLKKKPDGDDLFRVLWNLFAGLLAIRLDLTRQRLDDRNDG